MTKSILILIIFLGFQIVSYCQEEVQITTLSDSEINNSYASKLIYLENNDEAEEYAAKDIENKTPFLLINGGVAPSFSISQIDFEKTYKVYYYRFGCSFPDSEIARTYNYFILDYINDKYGEDCIKSISNDVFNLKEWKKLTK